MTFICKRQHFEKFAKSLQTIRNRKCAVARAVASGVIEWLINCWQSREDNGVSLDDDYSNVF